MDTYINKALISCVKHYSHRSQQDTEGFLSALLQVFESDVSFLEKVAGLDKVVADHPVYTELQEVLFDLLLMNFFAIDAAKLEADYLESDEWEAIEDQTIDRGTELLNLLLYLRECADEGITPDLDDYLREFLLVDEDDFQDEYRIYEPVIAQPVLVESSYEEIANAAGKLSPDVPLASLFYAMLGFFYEDNPDDAELEEFTRHAPNPAFDLAVYQLTIHYNR